MQIPCKLRVLSYSFEASSSYKARSEPTHSLILGEDPVGITNQTKCKSSLYLPCQSAAVSYRNRSGGNQGCRQGAIGRGQAGLTS